MVCEGCKNKKCLGKYLLHTQELKDIPKIKEKELKLDPNIDFELIDSPSSGEVFTKFYELHIIKRD